MVYYQKFIKLEFGQNVKKNIEQSRYYLKELDLEKVQELRSFNQFCSFKNKGWRQFQQEIKLNPSSYRLARLFLGKPINGQRTRTNGKTAKKLNRGIFLQNKNL